ncbi:MAG: TRAP transporter substrate-binding protein DctP [Desulfatibacillaceae bacterium]|nr:TRAP transporter substrate-binding protein DctP [Desulfatibacillaceae bacterium]
MVARPLPRIAALTALCFGACLFLAGPAFASRTWKMATLAPKEMGWSRQVREIVLPWVETATGNNLKWKVYWGGVMGNDEDYIKKLRIRQLDGAGLSAAGANMACPEMSVLGLPFLFESYEDVDLIRDGFFDTFDGYFQNQGFKLLLWVDQGFDETYSARRTLRTIEDFSRAKFQNWYGPMETATLRALGVSPISMNVMEGHSGYKTGVIDASFAPALYMVGSQLYTVLRYVNPMKIRYSPGVIVLNLENWNSLPQTWRTNISAGRDDVTRPFLEANRRDNQRSLEAMLHYGLKLSQSSPDDLAEFARRTLPIYEQFAGVLYPKELLEEIKEALEAFRVRQAGDIPDISAP